ncbi:DUF4932 domain-containing protein [Terrimonas sp. NA20]|uniref:DUF4932 domain-containing protein n=1 Tax=Terrimonas ginsenosidimutans TaxID=2908004 RepID=A0ABS9KQI0_9BACT|nr:DUF4932 domain-containing protein [Terrimonas ginsenosidimutans]MCG2614584.1 DUF4932 domain-containing protein [Terrimonas ginsenosidimutans]
MKKTFIILLACFGFSSVRSQVQDKLKVDVHPGVELFTIIQILANQFPKPNPSAYTKEAMAYFSPYKDHPAVKKVAGFGKVYTDLVELGWCMSGFPEIKIYTPEQTSWYDYYGKENVKEYINLCRDFFNETKFWDFFLQHSSRYKKWGDELKTKVDSAGLVQKLQGFYKYDADVRWWICIDPLNSWGSHAIMTKTLNPPFSDWIVYNTGFFKRDGDSLSDPVFEFRDFDNLVFHEGSHVYVNGLFDKYEKQIDELSYLFNKDDEGMKRNTIGNWRYCLDENIVRAVTATLYRQYRSERAYKKQLARELLSDFIYVEELESFIHEKYVQGKKYKTFAEFFPEILVFLKKKHPGK